MPRLLLHVLVVVTTAPLVAQSMSSADLAALLKQYGAETAHRDVGRYIVKFAGDRLKQRCLPEIRRVLEHPVQSLDFSLELTDFFRDHCRPLELSAVLTRVTQLLDLKPAKVVAPAKGKNAMESWIARLERATELCDAAFAKLDAASQAKLAKAAPVLVADFINHIYVHKQKRNLETWKLANAVDYAALLAAAGLLAPALDRKFLAPIRKAALSGSKTKQAPPGVKGRVVFARETRAGWVIVGGKGDNEYDLPCAFILDLGGDDVYHAQATASDRTQRVNVVIDVRGNDRYVAKGYCAQGCGRFGVSFLVDHVGDDVYEAERVAQGACLCGVGILADYRGNDRYKGDALVQGAGGFGFGWLFDREGDDEMQAHLSSQGFAWPVSVGLCLDLEGKDRRIGTGKYGSSYGTKGQFNGMCQGAGVGFRTVGCGGFGVLIDGGGDDVSDAGEFGHGCGYYFGAGIVRDYGGDDDVKASRYGIATGAHFGIGTVIDDAGNDKWMNRSVASIAGNWDLTVSCFLDRRGNDRYQAPGLSLGCATITSFSSFADLDGKDEYVCASPQSFGRGGHAEDLRRKSESVAVFLDLGGDADKYPAQKHAHAPRNGHASAVVIEQPDGKAKRVVGRGLFVDR